jgi:hypothetical protein
VKVWYRVRYQIATYAGSVDVEVDEDADRDHVVAVAEAKLKRSGGVLPLGARSYQVERA